jgi:hypothetical protein
MDNEMLDTLRRLFVTVDMDYTDIDVMDTVDMESSELMESMHQLRKDAEIDGCLTYMAFFQRPECEECVIMEKRFVNLLYNEHNISMSPWLSFIGHIIVPSKVFCDMVDVELLRALPKRF